MWDTWVIDATFGVPGSGAFWFIPIEGELGSPDCKYVIGMSYGGDIPPHDGKCVGIIHENGQAAVEAFYEQHKADLSRFDFAPGSSESNGP